MLQEKYRNTMYPPLKIMYIYTRQIDRIDINVRYCLYFVCIAVRFADCSRTFFFHVLKADPSCGQRVLALAKCLTTKMLEGALDLDCAKKTGTLGFEFLFNLSSVVALKVPGAFNDLDSLGWRQLPLIPTEQEIHAQNISK